jgi:Calcineurin-like phosphoesterase
MPEHPKRKNLGNFLGPFHSGLASHFRAGGSDYSTEKYDPLYAFLPGRLLKWVPHVMRYWFHKKHPYRDYSDPARDNGIYKIENKTSLSILGDWGTGTDEAHAVAQQALAAHPDYTVHLGDVYYVGDATEVRENFFGEKTSPYAPVTWPMGSKASFALLGNHEMYARGSGYFNSILPRMGFRTAGAAQNAAAQPPFNATAQSPTASTPRAANPPQQAVVWGSGQWASFFCLENEYWRIIGLDTGYNSTAFDWGKMPGFQRLKGLRKSLHFKPKCEIPAPMLDWLQNTVQPDADKRGLILLSHHGSHSAFSDWYRFPAMQLAKIIHRPVLWFWGHEHKVAIYGKFAPPEGIESYGRCVGHAGMPVERGWQPDIECNLLAWDNRLYKSDENISAGINGHANLRLDGPSLHVDYVDLTGQILFTEDWRVDLTSGALAGPNLKQIINDPDVHIIR